MINNVQKTSHIIRFTVMILIKWIEFLMHSSKHKSIHVSKILSNYAINYSIQTI